jgi:hypothetical protein
MTSLPYALLFCVFLFTAFLEHYLVRQHRVLAVRIIVVVVALVFFGLRGHVLTDFINYYEFFRKLDASQLGAGNSIYGPGFVLHAYLSKLVFDNYHFWIFVSTSIHVLILSAVFRKYLGNISLGLIFFLGYRGVLIEFNLLQNFMAILLFFLSIPYLYKRRFLPYLFLNVIGMTFHVTSVLYFPLYFVLQRNTSMQLGLIIIGAANLFYFVGSDLLINAAFWVVSNSGYATLEGFLYFFVDTSNYQLSFGFLERTLVILLMTVYCEKIKSEIPCGTIFYNLALLYYFSFLLLSPVDVLADRIPMLFLLSWWVIIPALILLKHRYRTVIACGLITLSFAKLVLSTQDQVAEYDNLIFGIRPYDERLAEVLQHNEANK